MGRGIGARHVGAASPSMGVMEVFWVIVVLFLVYRIGYAAGRRRIIIERVLFLLSAKEQAS